MPIYEFECKKCKNVFSKLIISVSSDVKCPNCGSEDVSKKISKVTSFSLNPSGSGSCGCGGGSSSGFS